jgi:hydrogenase maturation protein HypF
VELDWAPLIAALDAGRLAGRDPRELAASFHRALAAGIVSAARAAGVGTVALGGGCFQNALLTDLASSLLEAEGFEVLVPRVLPPNDGAIAAGQALGALLNLTAVCMT